MYTPLKINVETKADDDIQPFRVTLADDHEQFYFEVQHKGYALLQLPDVAVELIEQLRDHSKTFFNENKEIKEQYFEAQYDAGYMSSRGIKETFQFSEQRTPKYSLTLPIQIRHVPAFTLWPSPVLAASSRRTYLLFDAIARTCLAALVERYLHVTAELEDDHVTGDLTADHATDPSSPSDPVQLVSSVLDPLTSTWSNSCLNVFHYTRPHSTGCIPHTDGGLLTLIPGTSESGLELYSPLTRDWHAGPRDRSICLVLLGDTVARLTRGMLSATLHRVLTEQPRMSTVFKQRAKLMLVGARSDAEARVLAELVAPGMNCKLKLPDGDWSNQSFVHERRLLFPFLDEDAPATFL